MNKITSITIIVCVAVVSMATVLIFRPTQIQQGSDETINSDSQKQNQSSESSLKEEETPLKTSAIPNTTISKANDGSFVIIVCESYNDTTCELWATSADDQSGKGVLLKDTCLLYTSDAADE